MKLDLTYSKASFIQAIPTTSNLTYSEALFIQTIPTASSYFL